MSHDDPDPPMTRTDGVLVLAILVFAALWIPALLWLLWRWLA